MRYQGQREEGQDGDDARFGMLQVIREYALERLAASGVSAGHSREEEALRQAHLDYFLPLAERAHPELAGPAISSAWT